MSRHAYAVCGVTHGEPANRGGERQIDCYFDNLSDAAQYLSCTKSWDWKCRLYRLEYKLMSDESVAE